jgi:hypothetical protein
MKLWEFVLAEDDQVDLSRREVARKWLRERGQWPPGASAHASWPWRECPPAQWRRCVLALRSLAARLAGKRSRRLGRETPGDQLRADRAAEACMNAFQQRFRLASSRPLTRATHGDYTLGLVWYRVSDGSELSLEELSAPSEARRPLDFVWFQIFHSLLTDGPGPHLCQGCMHALPKTRKGRDSRRKYCVRCSFKRWRASQPQGKMRERWRLAKAIQRAH